MEIIDHVSPRGFVIEDEKIQLITSQIADLLVPHIPAEYLSSETLDFLLGRIQRELHRRSFRWILSRQEPREHNP